MGRLDYVEIGMEIYRDLLARESSERPHLTELVAPTPAVKIAQFNKAKLLHYESSQPRVVRDSVLLVPSLINRAYILDLLKGYSLVEHLLKEGLDVYMLDWGIPTDEDREIEFDSLIESTLKRTVRKVCLHSGREQVRLVGYCMGGTLASIYASLYPDQISGLINLLGPIDFSKAGMLADWTDARNFNPKLMTESFGNVPPALMQSAFQGMRPLSQVAKVLRPQPEISQHEKDFYAALEFWSWDNIAFPGRAYQKYIGDLYQKNKLVHGELVVGASHVDLKNIKCPILIFTADKDHIVPVASANALADFGDAAQVTTVTVRGGHVAAVVGPQAKKLLWPKLSSWLKETPSPIE